MCAHSNLIAYTYNILYKYMYVVGLCTTCFYILLTLSVLCIFVSYFICLSYSLMMTICVQFYMYILRVNWASLNHHQMEDFCCYTSSSSSSSSVHSVGGLCEKLQSFDNYSGSFVNVYNGVHCEVYTVVYVRRT